MGHSCLCTIGNPIHAAPFPIGRFVTSELRFLRYRRHAVRGRRAWLRWTQFHSITTQCREECCPIKRYRLPRYRGELSNVIALNQLLPLAQKGSVRMLERTVGRPGAT